MTPGFQAAVKRLEGNGGIYFGEFTEFVDQAARSRPERPPRNLNDGYDPEAI